MTNLKYTLKYPTEAWKWLGFVGVLISFQGSSAKWEALLNSLLRSFCLFGLFAVINPWCVMGDCRAVKAAGKAD